MIAIAVIILFLSVLDPELHWREEFHPYSSSIKAGSKMNIARSDQGGQGPTPSNKFWWFCWVVLVAMNVFNIHRRCSLGLGLHRRRSLRLGAKVHDEKEEKTSGYMTGEVTRSERKRSSAFQNDVNCSAALLRGVPHSWILHLPTWAQRSVKLIHRKEEIYHVSRVCFASTTLDCYDA